MAHDELVSVPQRMTAVTLGARNMPRLRAFYRALGWRENDGSDDTYTSLTLGGVRLARYPITRLGAEAAPGDEVLEQGPWNGVTFAVTVADRNEVDQVFGYALQAGAQVRFADGTRVGWLFRLRRRPGGQPLGGRMGALVHRVRLAPPRLR